MLMILPGEMCLKAERNRIEPLLAARNSMQFTSTNLKNIESKRTESVPGGLRKIAIQYKLELRDLQLHYEKWFLDRNTKIEETRLGAEEKARHRSVSNTENRCSQISPRIRDAGIAIESRGGA